MRVVTSKKSEKLIKKNYKKYIKSIDKQYKLVILVKNKLVKY